MTSKVLIKLPTAPFLQGKKAQLDLVSISERSQEGLTQVKQQGINIDKVAQLEQNMKFLQEQHHATLIALHQEVENLRQRNRDLQFQLVFAKGTVCVPSSPSSPEDNGSGFAKSKDSPVFVNITPLQIELLEQELQDLKASLEETKTHNQYLSKIIEHQKEKLEAVEGHKNKVLTADVGTQLKKYDLVDTEVKARLLFMESWVTEFRKENIRQRKEIEYLRATSTINGSTSRGGRSRDSNNSHHSRGSPTTATQEQTSHKFPPLETQSYWHRRMPRNGKARHDKQGLHSVGDSTALPHLLKCEHSRFRDYHNYYRESTGKYRGQLIPRDEVDTDFQSNRRDYRSGNSKDHQKEYVDSAEGSGNAENSQRH